MRLSGHTVVSLGLALGLNVVLVGCGGPQASAEIASPGAGAPTPPPGSVPGGLPAMAPTAGPGIMRPVADAQRAQRSVDVVLGPLDAAGAQKPSAGTPGPLKVGVGRAIAQTQTAVGMRGLLQWTTLPSGHRVAAITFTSLGAKSLRLGVLVQHLPAQTLLRFYAPQAALANEVPAAEVLNLMALNRASGDTSVDARTYWSPIVMGEKITFEIQMPANTPPAALDIAVGQLSHLF